jgi:hypothetical protein
MQSAPHTLESGESGSMRGAGARSYASFLIRKASSRGEDCLEEVTTGVGAVEPAAAASRSRWIARRRGTTSVPRSCRGVRIVAPE